jgi:hypothetical protein
MPKKPKRREWTKDDVRELKTPCSSEDASGQNCEVTETNAWSDAAEGVLTWRIVRHARVGQAPQNSRVSPAARLIGPLALSAPLTARSCVNGKTLLTHAL